MGAYSQRFIAATDHKGKPLYPNARLIVEHDGVCLIEWESVVAVDEEPSLQRTWIDEANGAMSPGIFGDAEHVYKAMARKSLRNVMTAQRNRNRILREIFEMKDRA